MKNVFVEDIAMAEREAASERGTLNGVKFLQIKSGSGGGGEYMIVTNCPCVCKTVHLFTSCFSFFRTQYGK